jgi:REP element-mobilizing transposase RayT
MQRIRQHFVSSTALLLILIAPQTCHHSHMWNDTDTPLAYFISFRSYGTWLHGDKPGSIDRFHNAYRSSYIAHNPKWRRHNEQRLKAEPLILQAKARKSVQAAVRETCDIRKWLLQAINVRTNHIHTVVSANRKADLVLNAFKANATRQLRQDGIWTYTFSRGQMEEAGGDYGTSKALLGLSTMY